MGWKRVSEKRARGGRAWQAGWSGRKVAKLLTDGVLKPHEESIRKEIAVFRKGNGEKRLRRV